MKKIIYKTMNKELAIKILKEINNKLEEFDPSGYINGFGLFGSTSRDKRKITSDVDIMLFLNINKLDEPFNKKGISSIFGIPPLYFNRIELFIQKEFGINPFTNDYYVKDIVSLYEIRKFENEVMKDLIII